MSDVNEQGVMKDAIGQDLNIGDTVAVAQSWDFGNEVKAVVRVIDEAHHDIFGKTFIYLIGTDPDESVARSSDNVMSAKPERVVLIKKSGN